MHLRSCWSPCFWHDNVRDGSVCCAIYTLLASICSITYLCYIMSGGDSSSIFLPFFESDVDGDLQFWGAFFIVFMVLLGLFSLLLVLGVLTDIRGLFLPWIVLMAVLIVVQFCYGLHILYIYYIYLEVVLAIVIDYLIMGVHVYTVLVVKSHYANVRKYQSPDIEYLDTY